MLKFFPCQKNNLALPSADLSAVIYCFLVCLFPDRSMKFLFRIFKVALLFRNLTS